MRKKRNRLNARKLRKQKHCVRFFTQRTQAPANRKQPEPITESSACVACVFRLRNARIARNARNASACVACVWMETGLFNCRAVDQNSAGWQVVSTFCSLWPVRVFGTCCQHRYVWWIIVCALTVCWKHMCLVESVALSDFCLFSCAVK